MEERMVILHQGETCGQLAEPLRRICVLARRLEKCMARALGFDAWNDGMTEEQPSKLIIGQRIRNRIMEALAILADGNEGVRAVEPTEYFESFYDWVPH